MVREVPMSQACQGPQKMLLCIDDSPEILEYERRMLEQSGYIVVTTRSARRGLKLTKMYSFDAVVLDYLMPEMNGHQLAHEIRCLRPGTPVVMFSGSEVPDETRQLVNAVVPKAEARRELLPTVARLCDPLMPS
jgi:CheY-like chemotaxis protein